MKLVFLLLNLMNFNSNFSFDIVLEHETLYEEIISVNEESYIGINKNYSELYYDEKIYRFDNYIVTSTVENINYIYLISNQENASTVISFNKFNKTINYHDLIDTYINKIYDVNQSLYLIGNTSNNGIILNLNYDLELINSRTFDSDGQMTINNLIVEDYIYLSIYKDGITNNSEFINHGNYNTKKSIIVKLDYNYNILNTYYINNSNDNEIVKNMYLKDNKLFILLKTTKKYTIYQIDDNLNNGKYFDVNTQNNLELLNNHKTTKDNLILDKTTCSLIRVNNFEYEIVKEFKELNYINDYKIINGKLYLYSIYEKVLITKVSEYEIIKNEPKELNIYNLDYMDTSNVKVESWFEPLTIQIDKIEPYFEKTVSGKYNVTYIVKHLDESITEVNGYIIIDSYTNFINKGVYKTGKVLEFFGSARLNNQVIYNGTQLSTPGEYDIEIIDANGNIDIYHLYIVDDYYKEEKIVNIKSTNIYENQAYVNIEISDYNVINIIVNNEIYDDYTVIENTLVINFHKIDNISSYILNGITLQVNTELVYYEINKHYTFNFLKEKPKIYLNPILEQNNILLETLVTDKEKTFMYIKAVSNGLEKIITSNTTIKESNLSLYFVYELGDGKLNEVLISQIEHNESTNTLIEFKFNNGSLENININFEIKQDLLNTLNIENSSFMTYYKDVEKPSFLFNTINISIFIFLLIGIGFGFFLIVKKIKKNAF